MSGSKRRQLGIVCELWFRGINSLVLVGFLWPHNIMFLARFRFFFYIRTYEEGIYLDVSLVCYSGEIDGRKRSRKQ